jgi:hypothetical protein
VARLRPPLRGAIELREQGRQGGEGALRGELREESRSAAAGEVERGAEGEAHPLDRGGAACAHELGARRIALLHVEPLKGLLHEEVRVMFSAH